MHLTTKFVLCFLIPNTFKGIANALQAVVKHTKTPYDDLAITLLVGIANAIQAVCKEYEEYIKSQKEGEGGN